MKLRVRKLGMIGFPNYKVRIDGKRVWSREYPDGPWRPLTISVRDDGRQYVRLHGKKRNTSGRSVGEHWFVHELVLSAFVRLKRPGEQCRHFPDPDPTNNRLENLQWGTQAENEADKVVHGTTNRGSRNGRSVLTESQVTEIRELWQSGRFYQKEIAAKFGVCQGLISLIVNRRNWVAA